MGKFFSLAFAVAKDDDDDGRAFYQSTPCIKKN